MCKSQNVSEHLDYNSKQLKYNKLNFKKGRLIYLKQISKEEMKKLVNNKYLHNSAKGFVNRAGNIIGFYRTRNKLYIEDKYADIANRLK